MPFRDRSDAGRRLAGRLEHLRGHDAVVLGLPRGGVAVAAEVAAALRAPLDVIVVRKLGVPYQPELAMGAVGEDGVRVLNDDVLRVARVKPQAVATVEAAERRELERRSARFRKGRPRASLRGRIAIVVDDGIATGATARAACQVARAQGATRVVLAVPVAPPDAARALLEVADDVVTVETPVLLSAIGQWYEDFSQTPDAEVVRLLEQADARADGPQVRAVEVDVDAGVITLPGQLSRPAQASGVVVFAHGSGSSRHSPRNQHVATVLADAGLATLLLDLLTTEEAGDRDAVFDIGLLAGRLAGTIRWLRQDPATAQLDVGLFGASTGAAAALWAASAAGDHVGAVVSRGGRPDLAAPRLGSVRAPTLLIVGGLDHAVLDLNQTAQRQLRCVNRLDVVPGATHLFEEPGTLETVAGLARDWFRRYLTAGGRQASRRR